VNTGEFLDKPELHQLTGHARAVAQAEWLESHGIPHLLEGKRLVVSRVHVRARLEGKPLALSFVEPDLTCVR
jgi:hypothetical protein